MTRLATCGPPRLARLGAVGLAAAALTWVAGLVWVPLRYADSTEGLRTRLEREVRDTVTGRVETLAAVARQLRADDATASLRNAPADISRLFELASSAVAVAGAADHGVTVYGPDRVPLAWAGRSSALPARLVTAPEGALVARGTAGLYLVWVDPITATGDGPLDDAGRRLGTIVVETILADGPRGSTGEAHRFTLATSLVPVTLRLPDGTTSSDDTFDVLRDGAALVSASVASSELALVRDRAREGVVHAVVGVLAVTLLALAVAAIGGRDRRLSPAFYGASTIAAVALFLAGRYLAGLAAPPVWDAGSLRSPAVYTSGLLGSFTASPLALLLSGLLALTLVSVLVDPARRWRIDTRPRRVGPMASRGSLTLFVVAQLAAGALVWGLARGIDLLVADTVANSSADLLWLSWQPWNAGRLAVQFGLIAAHVAAFWTTVLVLRVALMPFRLSRRPIAVGAVSALWLVPAAIALLAAPSADQPLSVGGLLMLVAAPVAAWISLGGLGWYRRGSRALQLAVLFFLVVGPALLLLPTLERHTDRTRRGLIETLYTSQVMGHAVELQARLSSSLQQVDRLDWLPPLLGGGPRGDTSVGEAAFAVWSQTDLAEFRLTSAVELYGIDDELVSRFALNFPEYGVTARAWDGAGCRWEVSGEAMPFGSGERRVLRAGRNVCLERRGTLDVVGSVVVEVVLDYGALPFISRQDPYVQLFSRDEPTTPGVNAGRDVDLAIYGWGRYPLYTSSGRAWPLPDPLFERIYASRDPLWVTLPSGGDTYEVFIANDHLGIYALGYPPRDAVEQLILGSELATLVALGFVIGAVLMGLFGLVAAGWRQPGQRLWQEVRTSFYRKLFLSFVLAAVGPVLVLAFVATQFVAARLREGVEAEAASTAAVAQRVIEETLALQEAAGQPAVINDDLMVWISRVIDQDVNIFEGPELVATSERDLFTSGLLPMRTPEAVYRAVMLDRLPSYVGEDRVGDFRYLTAAAPVQGASGQRILTVPLTLRQQEIERQIDDLGRGVNLGAVVFVLLGAAIGFWMAERIGDPVQRLTRAARRIASGDLDTRVAVRTSDELGRLVEAFNRMADDLRRQRAQLERTHRLEAWAQMARQVAHDIKNPLTPIQLSAEHLRRVNRDNNRALSPALDACVDAILSQVRLLRQIAGEFSAFAMTPVARPAPTDLASIVEEVVAPYRPGVEGRVEIEVTVETGLAKVFVDRQLLGRALTNVIENALHAMPGGGTLTVATASAHDGRVGLNIRDTGVGMDEDDLRRVFEPYFSTKASGTGLGLSIARRNVELQGGQIAVESRPGAGTTVTISLPAAAAD